MMKWFFIGVALWLTILVALLVLGGYEVAAEDTLSDSEVTWQPSK